MKAGKTNRSQSLRHWLLKINRGSHVRNVGKARRIAAFQMEKRGIRTGRGNINREIEVTNGRLRQLRARIYKLQNWLKKEAANTEPSILADYIQGIRKRKTQAGKSGALQSLYNLKDAANMLNFLTDNGIKDMAGIDKKFSSMIGAQMDIRDKLKPVKWRLATLKKHMEQGKIYMEYKGKKSLTESDVYIGAQLSKRRDGRQDRHTGKGMEIRIFQADHRAEKAQPKVSC